MKRSPAAAFWLAMLPGAGHVYLGQTSKGFTLILAFVSSIVLASEASGAFFGPLIAFVVIFSMIDAHRSAVEHNLLVETGQPLPRPQDLGFALGKWWGWVLIALGVVFTVDNYGWFRIDWIFDLWPIGLIALGVYILRSPTKASNVAPQHSSDDG